MTTNMTTNMTTSKSKMTSHEYSPELLQQLTQEIKDKGISLGFQAIGISDTNLQEAENHLQPWLDANKQGSMSYMGKHGKKRTTPDLLVPGTQRIISVRMDYYPTGGKNALDVLNNRNLAYISRYSLGRDYHKVLRQRLKQLSQFISEKIGPFGHRVFVDSAPVMEKAIAEKSGLGWIGKHSNLLSRDAGSWFFLGEIFVDIPLILDSKRSSHCGECTKCIVECPTQAIVSPYSVDARRCISYLTIENKGAIPLEFRKAIGNRIYGCDDCQLVCPWNRFSEATPEVDFIIRHQLDNSSLLTLFSWNENTFLSKTEGSAIRRIGHQSWLRNISVALGNSEKNETVIVALRTKRHNASELLKEHMDWAIAQQLSKSKHIDH